MSGRPCPPGCTCGHHNPTSRRQAVETTRLRHPDGVFSNETRQKMSTSRYCFIDEHPDVEKERHQKQSKTRRENLQDPDERQRHKEIAQATGASLTPEQREARRQKTIQWWESLSDEERSDFVRRRGVSRHTWYINLPDDQKEYYAEMSRQHLRMRPFHNTSLEIAVQESLRQRGFDLNLEYRIGRFWVDIYLEKYHLCIECDGLYWHSDPEDVEYDQQRDNFIRSRGHEIVRLTEYEITQTLEQSIDSKVVPLCLGFGS